MRPKKEESHYYRKPPEPQKQPDIKIRFYTLIFTDKPEVKHEIIISQKDNRFSYEIRFSKPLIHLITKSKTSRDNLSCNNLNELKRLLRSYLKGFGEYIIIHNE